MLERKSLKIEGMHCDACVRRVRAALSNVEGVQVKDVAVGRADIIFDSSKATEEGVVNAVNDIGFTAQVANNS